MWLLTSACSSRISSFSHTWSPSSHMPSSILPTYPLTHLHCIPLLPSCPPLFIHPPSPPFFLPPLLFSSILPSNTFLLSSPGPSRQELKFMAEYKKQAEGQTSPSDPQQPPSSSSSSSMGMMRIPGRGSRPTYGLDLGPGGDTTFEAAVLGELAVISIEPDVRIEWRGFGYFISIELMGVGVG